MFYQGVPGVPSGLLMRKCRALAGGEVGFVREFLRSDDAGSDEVIERCWPEAFMKKDALDSWIMTTKTMAPK